MPYRTHDDALRLPLLERAKIASPCNVPWDDMLGDDRIRFCGHCAKDVYNVIAMSRHEAETLLSSDAKSSVCMRLYRRKDGTILTADCPVGQKKKRRRRVVAAAVGSLGLTAGALAASPSEPAIDTRLAIPVIECEETFDEHDYDYLDAAETTGMIASPLGLE